MSGATEVGDARPIKRFIVWAPKADGGSRNEIVRCETMEQAQACVNLLRSFEGLAEVEALPPDGAAS